MSSRFAQVLIFSSLLCTSAVTRADTLFINLNWSVEESDSIHAAVEKTGENLLEFPNFKNADIRSQAQKREALERKLLSLTKNYYSLSAKVSSYGFFGKVFSKKYREYLKQSEDYSAKIKEVEAEKAKIKSVAVSLDEIKNKIAELDQFGKEITAIVVSGHSSGNYFWGNDVSITREFIISLTQRFPKVFNRLEAFIFLACHSGETDKFLLWRDLLKNPNRQLIVGFDGSAPSHFSDESHNIVMNSLAGRKSLLDQNPDPEKIKTWFKALDPNVRQTALTLLVNEWVGGSSSRLVFKDIKNLTEDCNVGYGLITTGFQSYRSNLTPSKENAKVVITDSQNSPLRIFYRALQKYMGVCQKEFSKKSLFAKDAYYKVPTAEQVVALIHMPNLEMALMHHRGKEVQELNESLTKLGAKEEILFSEKLKLGAVSRYDLTAQTNQLKDFLDLKAIKVAGNAKTLAFVKKLQASTLEIESLLVKLENIPVNWITYE